MKVCLDATALMCLLDTRLNEFPAPDGSIVGNMRRRMDHLIASIDQVNRATPALAASWRPARGNRREQQSHTRRTIRQDGPFANLDNRHLGR